ncbi:MAG TPA: PrsW family glutamic-type intramembrane protease [Acidimicrobiales bacterium]|nr:PrsW family glutamic-type intramembrane protease [Acidimicrobiales bacterium]
MDIRTEAAIAAFVPSLLWLALVYGRDRYEKEPKRLVAKCYALSLLAVAMAFVLESLARPRLTGAAIVVVGSALVVGLIEEGSKFAVLVLGTRRNPNLNEPVDGMVYATAVALGFAGLESLTYILRSYDVGLAYHLSPSSAAHLALVSTAPVRALVGNLGHMAWTGVIGYAYGRWRCGIGSRAAVLRAYLVAACGHATYDALLGLHASVLAFTVLALGVAFYIHLFRRALAASPFRHHQVRARPLSPPPAHPGQFAPDTLVPMTGLPAWAQPAPTSRLVGQLPPGLPVQVVERLGAWAHVRTSTGWSGWVDGRVLQAGEPPESSRRRR